MKLRYLVYLWSLVTIFMLYEYLILHKVLSGQSVISLVSCRYLHYCKPLTPLPGRPLSYALGWLGFGVMALTNAYILRKRLVFIQSWGKLQSWLDWHIFFGMLGPTFILFHCDFKVRGLVSISFWSMVISFLSGIVGRYFYMQLLQAKPMLKSQIDTLEKGFDKYIQHSGNRISQDAMLMAKAHAFAMAGGVQGNQLKELGMAGFIVKSLLGEIRMATSLPPTPWRESRPFRIQLKQWAILRRRLLSMHFYQILFGYWRTFHSPFAIWMYVVAVIHIASSLIFRV
ncbi:MAG: hypothetical protein NTX25_00555 [Proteobacteria bacterium]|nr:hypothetical protein [Pseudomonadota bacterium]